MQILSPASMVEAEALLRLPGHCALAGGTALQLQWAQGVARPEVLVDIARHLPDEMSCDGDRVTLGAGMRLEDLRAASIPLVSQALADVAAPGVRRLGTLGGQIGWGAGCLLPALLVLEADVRTTAGDLSLAEFLKRPQGLVLSISITLPPADVTLTWRKFGLRRAFSPSLLNVAALESASGLRLAVGGGPVQPCRLTAVETCPPEERRDAVFSSFVAPDCAHRSGAWRQKAVANLLRTPTGLARQRRRPESSQPAQPMPLSAFTEDWHIRPDMPTKVSGRMPYLTDARRPDMLVGRILRAAHPHAQILSIDTSAAEALPGVKAVITHRDVPGLNAFGIVFQDQPALCFDKVRYLGDPVAAVAAIDDKTAEAALALIAVQYQPLPVIDDPQRAVTDLAGTVHASGNKVSEHGLSRGSPDTAFARAAHVVESTYHTPRQMHGFMETEGGHAEVLPDGTLLISVGGQHGARDRLQLARILGRDGATIRVITSPTGGAFGGKDELTVQPVLALLALKAGQPVRLQLSRAESVLAGTKRNPMRIRMRTACDPDGKIVAQDVDVLSDCGAYTSLSPGVLETAMEHAGGPYLIPNIRTYGCLTYTNNGTGGAFRGFGANQMAFAMECQIDRLAAACGLDPAEMRRRNLRVPGDPGFLGQKVAPSERLIEMIEAAAASPLWSAPRVDGEWIEGTGMSLIWQGNGLGTIPEDRAEGQVRLAPDGAIEVLCGLDEMGQGLLASLVASVADSLGVARGDIRPVTGDTGIAPDSGSTTASRGGFVVWSIAQNTAAGFRGKLLKIAAQVLGKTSDRLQLVPGGIGEIGGNRPDPLLTFEALARAAMPSGLPFESTSFDYPKTDYGKGNARFLFCAGANVARVAVSRISGEVRVRALDMHTAAGPVIDLAAYLGQMEGGVVQGLGFTLTEDVVMRAGVPLARNLDGYVMPSIRDVPPILTVTALTDLDPGDPYGPRGAGELGIGGVTPAIANAIADAVGFWPTRAPFSAEDVLNTMETR